MIYELGHTAFAGKDSLRSAGPVVGVAAGDSDLLMPRQRTSKRKRR
jgi:hypothetical protein